jgi:hypothetical protein
VVASLEDAEDYEAFEATIIADYHAETAVARELVLRLASLLWRLRRATGIETDLLAIQADLLRERFGLSAAKPQPDGAAPRAGRGNCYSTLVNLQLPTPCQSRERCVRATQSL